MKRLITVLMAVMLLLTPSCKFMESINPFGRKAREAEALQKQQEAFRVADSIKVAAEKVAQEKENQAELARQAAEEEARLAAESVSKYHIIVGSFLTPDYASSWLSHCRDMGYDARIIEWNDGRWKLVSAGSYETLRAAYNELPAVLNSFDMQAWVLAGK
mgnify:CR=1 FL=1